MPLSANGLLISFKVQQANLSISMQMTYLILFVIWWAVRSGSPHLETLEKAR